GPDAESDREPPASDRLREHEEPCLQDWSLSAQEAGSAAVDVDVIDLGSQEDAVRERDLPTVWRPGRPVVGQRRMSDARLAGAVGDHRLDLRMSVALTPDGTLPSVA